MRQYFVLFLLFISAMAVGQDAGTAGKNAWENSMIDSLIKQRLIDLSMANPAFAESNAQIQSSKFELKAAKSSWLNTVVLSGNVNEFVVNNTTINGVAASTLYPKYNLGVNIPLGILGKQEKNIAREKVKLYQAQQEGQVRALKKEVLSRYETYKEKKDLLDLQKQITEGQSSNYQIKQKEYSSGEIKDINEVNKEYEIWLDGRIKLRTKEKDLMIAQLDLEEIIGAQINDVLIDVLSKK